MAVAQQYDWGTLRPSAVIVTRDNVVGFLGPAALMSMEERHRAERESIDAWIERSAREAEYARIATRSGRYTVEDAKFAAETLGPCFTERAARGRPRKRAEGQSRPSRAKTMAGRQRALIKASGRMPGVEIRMPTKAPGLAPAVEEALLCTSAIVPLPSPTHIEAVCEKSATDQSVPAISAADAPVPEHNGIAQLFLQPSASRESSLSRPAQSYVQDRRIDRYGMVKREYVSRGARLNEIESLGYDFSDPHDPSKLTPELRKAFRGFGVPYVWPIDPMDIDRRNVTGLPLMEEDMFALWVGPAIFKDYDDYEPQIAKAMAEQGSAYSFWRMFASDFVDAVKLEMARPHVWESFESRVHYVEYYNHMVKIGQLSLEQAQVIVSRHDVELAQGLTFEQQVAFYRGVKLMHWFAGFSLQELRDWAGTDIDIHQHCREFQGFPSWAYPEKIGQAILNDEYEIPEHGEYAFIDADPNDPHVILFDTEYQRMQDLRLEMSFLKAHGGDRALIDYLLKQMGEQFAVLKAVGAQA